ncbi:MAG: glycogen/starch/alpha-glucan phosphorylase [Clostridia bacterium]|nr:glycogen/starch/alpha-glucan phosphorylase [Clostridia bacterium]
MTNTTITQSDIHNILAGKLSRHFGTTCEDATKNQIYKAVLLSVRDMLTDKRSVFKRKVKKQHKKRVYYMCMEFLIGRSLKNNLQNLGIEQQFRSALSEMGFDLDEIYAHEPDPGLGNGGLGRLAACFMDSLTTSNYPATGFSLCYEYGFFHQRIVDGNQVETPDTWMQTGDTWLVPRTDKTFSVKFGGKISEKWDNGRLEIINTDYDEVEAVPYDMMISGYDSEAVSNLRLWKARDLSNFNMKLFTQGQYMQAVQNNTLAETLTRVLYPSDDHEEGKILRLSQQYFLVSASLQNIIADHISVYGTLSNLPEKVAIHINDTHPALCIPELMRILMDIYSFSWESAWDTVVKTVSYTNHTVMPEALEKWNEDLFRLRLPRIYMIVCEINRRYCADLWNIYPGDWDRISRMSIIANGQVRMANLSVVGSHTVNGVSKLHSEILKETVFHDYYKTTPEKFTNVTNGIAHRRWLCEGNPMLSALLDKTITPAYRTDPEKIAEFARFKDDQSIVEAVREIKHRNKERFADAYFKKFGRKIDTHSLFDVQAKRIHEYKRQLLNVLKIVALYDEIKQNPNISMRPQTFLFGGKAAPGYYRAKDIIRLICKLGDEIDRDPDVKGRLKVVFLEEYNVSTAEILMPATDISEQISLAGKEASGTGCMKFMINGAMTVGTLDGANVEMADAVGDDNIYIFGLTAREVDELWKRGYHSMLFYRESERLKNAVDRICRGFGGEDFSDFENYFLTNQNIADPYMCLADFDSYFSTYNRALDDYDKRDEWTKRAIINIAGAGYFASDRSVREYAENIWHITPIDKDEK